MKHLNIMIESIYKNVCFSATKCVGCRVRDLTKSPVYKDIRACLIPKYCLYELIGADMICEECICVDKNTMQCKLLEKSFMNDNSSIKALKFCGYWSVTI